MKEKKLNRIQNKISGKVSHWRVKSNRQLRSIASRLGNGTGKPTTS